MFSSDLILVFKITASLLFPGLTILQIYRDWKAKDHRTKRFKNFTKFLMWMYLVPVFLTIITIIYDASESNKTGENISNIGIDQKVLMDSIKTLHTKLGTANNELLYLQQKGDSIINQNKELSTQISQYQIDLDIKKAQIELLQIRIKKLQSGQTSYYNFNGTYSEQIGGQMDMSIAAFPEFQEMNSALDQGSYKLLIDLCKKNMKNVPGWYTPHLYLGIAYFKTGNKEGAKKYFNYLVSEVSTEPYVSEARKYLSQIK